MSCYDCGSHDLELEESMSGTMFICCNKCDWVEIYDLYKADERDQGVKPLIPSLWCAKQTIWLYYFVYIYPRGQPCREKSAIVIYTFINIHGACLGHYRHGFQ